MKDILIIGAGKIGETMAAFLSPTGDYRITIADRSETQLARLPQRPNVSTLVLDAGDVAAVTEAAKGRFAILSASPYFLTVGIAQAARAAGAHYLDLTEDVRSTAEVMAIAEGADTAFIPQCGLAPGFISIVANDLAQRFDTLDEVKMRVGALPKFPTNGLKYNLTWSTDGLINEYCQPCDAIVEGERQKTRPLEGLEEFALDGIRYEAFNTSGGLGTMTETYAGRVREMNYRSVRYPGHRQIMKLLLDDLGLIKRQDLLREIIEAAIPVTLQDVVLVFVSVTGTRNGRLMQESHVSKIYDREINGEHFGAIQITTASGILAVLDMLAEGALTGTGLIKQEDIPLQDFLANRFGRHYGLDPISSEDVDGLHRAVA